MFLNRINERDSVMIKDHICDQAPRRSEGISIAKREVPGLRPGRMPTKR